MSTRMSCAGAWLARRFRYALRGPDGERGVIAILAAMLLTVMILGTAFAVDITGRVMELRRDQAAADLGALDASWGIQAGTYQTLAYASALRNGVDHTKSRTTVSAQLATYANGNCTVGGVSPNAVQVAVTTPYDDFFGASHSELTRYACATNSGKAQFSVGTTLVDVNVGLNALGTSGSLGLVGYQGLASGNITLGALATQLGFGALSPDQVLAQNVTVGQLLSASSGLLNASGNPTAAAQLSLLATAVNLASHGSSTVNLGKVLNLQQGNGVGLGTGVNLLQLIEGGVQLANQNAGIALGLNASLLGLTSISTNVTAIVPPTMSAYGPVGISATNTQATVSLTIGFNVSVGLSLFSVTLPINLTLGGATGTLTAIDCTSANPTDIKLGTWFLPVNTTISGGTIKLLGLNVATTGGTVAIPNSSTSGTQVNEPTNFNFIPPGNTPNPSLPTPVSVSSTLGTPTVALTITPLGLPIALTTAVLDPLVGTLVSNVVNAIGPALGASIGANVDTADYLGNKASCSAPSLVK
ncbi:MAG TPA: hypothetical protein VFW71_07660 [Actinomycetota bacterium]|nr:hypothetical protein [Actinomycetota bacterium]